MVVICGAWLFLFLICPKPKNKDNHSTIFGDWKQLHLSRAQNDQLDPSKPHSDWSFSSNCWEPPGWNRLWNNFETFPLTAKAHLNLASMITDYTHNRLLLLCPFGRDYAVKSCSLYAIMLFCKSHEIIYPKKKKSHEIIVFLLIW